MPVIDRGPAGKLLGGPLPGALRGSPTGALRWGLAEKLTARARVTRSARHAVRLSVLFSGSQNLRYQPLRTTRLGILVAASLSLETQPAPLVALYLPITTARQY